MPASSTTPRPPARMCSPHQLVRRVHRHVAEVLRLGVVGHLEAERIVGVEHRRVARHLDDDALDLGQLLERADAAEAQVVGLDVEHRADVAVAHAHARAEQPAARDLEHRHVDRAGRSAPCGPPSGPVMSPATVRWPSMYTPSVVVSPT